MKGQKAGSVLYYIFSGKLSNSLILFCLLSNFSEISKLYYHYRGYQNQIVHTTHVTSEIT